MTEFVCAQDIREKELQKQGFANPEKAYFRIGRAIFVIDILSKNYTQEEAVSTPLGLAASVNNPDLEFDREELDLIQLLHGSTGFLRIVVEGDEDCGFASDSTLLLTGYRGGLDDVIVDDKLLQTVHNSGEEIMRNFADFLEWRSGHINVPRWNTFDGTGYRVSFKTPLNEEGKNLAATIREFADKLEHKDDPPDWIIEKFSDQSPKVTREVE